MRQASETAVSERADSRRDSQRTESVHHYARVTVEFAGRPRERSSAVSVESRKSSLLAAELRISCFSSSSSRNGAAEPAFAVLQNLRPCSGFSIRTLRSSRRLLFDRPSAERSRFRSLIGGMRWATPVAAGSGLSRNVTSTDEVTCMCADVEGRRRCLRDLRANLQRLVGSAALRFSRARSLTLATGRYPIESRVWSQRERASWKLCSGGHARRAGGFSTSQGLARLPLPQAAAGVRPVLALTSIDAPWKSQRSQSQRGPVLFSPSSIDGPENARLRNGICIRPSQAGAPAMICFL